ncbi:skin secretory protein xP2-like [Sardina pilchardus]|uniref:skin secretory protein xP2-like n=1 Tax=Sardina pilchardus TaxID=27697 RepID=UPI002E11BB4B
MRKLLVCAVLIALLAIGAESSRVVRQAEEEGDVPAPVEEEAVAAPAEEVDVPAPAEEEAAPAPAEEEPAPAEEEAAPALAEETPAQAEAPAPVEEAPHAEEHSAPAPAEEEGTATRVMNTLRSYYDQTLNTASGYLEDIKGLKLEEKAKNLYVDTSSTVKTYAGVMQDQLYHMIGSQ